MSTEDWIADDRERWLADEAGWDAWDEHPDDLRARDAAERLAETLP